MAKTMTEVGVCGKSRGHKNDAYIGSCGLYTICDGVKNRPVEVLGTAFAGCYAANKLGAILDHLGGVEGAFCSGEALYEDLRIFIDKNTHDRRLKWGKAKDLGVKGKIENGRMGGWGRMLLV